MTLCWWTSGSCFVLPCGVRHIREDRERALKVSWGIFTSSCWDGAGVKRMCQQWASQEQGWSRAWPTEWAAGKTGRQGNWGRPGEYMHPGERETRRARVPTSGHHSLAKLTHEMHCHNSEDEIWGPAAAIGQAAAASQQWASIPPPCPRALQCPWSASLLCSETHQGEARSSCMKHWSTCCLHWAIVTVTMCLGPQGRKTLQRRPGDPGPTMRQLWAHSVCREETPNFGQHLCVRLFWQVMGPLSLPRQHTCL